MTFKVSSNPNNSVTESCAYHPCHSTSLEQWWLLLRMVPGEHSEPWPEGTEVTQGWMCPQGCGGCGPALIQGWQWGTHPAVSAQHTGAPGHFPRLMWGAKKVFNGP